MAEQFIRVLFRFHAGVPFRTASDEDKKEYTRQLKEIIAKWKASGVKLVGSFHGFGEGVGGYAHHILFDVPSLDIVQQMNSDMFGGLGRFHQRHSFDVGDAPVYEKIWESV